jgi:hypothetical protein
MEGHANLQAALQPESDRDGESEGHLDRHPPLQGAREDQGQDHGADRTRPQRRETEEVAARSGTQKCVHGA